MPIGLRTAKKNSRDKAINFSDNRTSKRVKQINKNLKELENGLDQLVYKTLDESNNLIKYQTKYKINGSIIVSSYDNTDYQELIISKLKDLSNVDFILIKHVKIAKFKLDKLITYGNDEISLINNINIELEILISDEASVTIQNITSCLNRISYPNMTSLNSPFLHNNNDIVVYNYSDSFNYWIIPKTNNNFIYYNCPNEEYANLLLDNHPNISSNDYEITDTDVSSTLQLQFINIDKLYPLTNVYNNLDNIITDKVTEVILNTNNTV